MNKTYFCILNCTENQAIYLFYCAPFVCSGLVFAQRVCVCARERKSNCCCCLVVVSSIQFISSLWLCVHVGFLLLSRSSEESLFSLTVAHTAMIVEIGFIILSYSHIFFRCSSLVLSLSGKYHTQRF